MTHCEMIHDTTLFVVREEEVGRQLFCNLSSFTQNSPFRSSRVTAQQHIFTQAQRTKSHKGSEEGLFHL